MSNSSFEFRSYWVNHRPDPILIALLILGAQRSGADQSFHRRPEKPYMWHIDVAWALVECSYSFAEILTRMKNLEKQFEVQMLILNVAG